MTELTPLKIFSDKTRERCLAKLKYLPPIVYYNGRKSAAVLVPLCVVSGEVSLLYTLRSTNLKAHGGQVSFPGGKSERKEKAVETALRETEEELGLPREKVQVWGQMPPVNGKDKNLLITPVIGVIDNFNINSLNPCKDEVDTVFTVTLSELCNTKNHAYFEYNGFSMPIFMYGDFVIWGITGVITHMFLSCLLPRHVYSGNFTTRKMHLKELMNSKL